jgi:hypothetical protein
MVRKAAREYSKTKEDPLSQVTKAAFDWFSTCYGAFTYKQQNGGSNNDRCKTYEKSVICKWIYVYEVQGIAFYIFKWG